MSSGIDSLGGIDTYRLIFLIGSYLMVYFCIAKGVKDSSKVAYITAPAPVILLFVLFFK